MPALTRRQAALPAVLAIPAPPAVPVLLTAPPAALPARSQKEKSPNTRKKKPAKGRPTETFRYFTNKSAGETAIAQNASFNGERIIPRRCDAYKFGKSQWENFPVPEDAPPGWSVGKWPPKSTAGLLSAAGRDLECEGQYLWGARPCQAAADNLDCGHTFHKWISGGLDWTSRFELQDTGDRGIGVFNLNTRWKRRDVIGCYTGRCIPQLTENEAEATNMDYIFRLPIGPNPPGGHRSDNWPLAFVDACRIGNWTRFINHSCRPNTILTVGRVGKQLVVVIQVRRKIWEGEEVTTDYRRAYFETAGIECSCGEQNCFSKKTKGKKKDWKKTQGKKKGSKNGPKARGSAPTGVNKRRAG